MNIDIIKNIFKIDLKKINIYTILAVLLLLSGLIHWLYWGVRYGVWTDIGIYSLTVVLVLSGILGILISLHIKDTD